MPRITPTDPATATGPTRELLDEIQATFGSTPNMLKTMAASPALLRGWFELTGALGTTLTRPLRERIAIALAEQNECGYCLAAHAVLGRMAGLDAFEIGRNRTGASSDEASAAAIEFALAVNATRGGVSDEELARVRAAGFDDAEIADIVGHVALNALTNYFNRVAHPVLDFPRVSPGTAEAA